MKFGIKVYAIEGDLDILIPCLQTCEVDLKPAPGNIGLQILYVDRSSKDE
jgi:hypothetical protein